MIKKSLVASMSLLLLASVCANAQEMKRLKNPAKENPIRECYSSTRTIVGLMPRDLFEACIKVQRGPLSKAEYTFYKVAHEKGVISKTDLFRLKNHYRVTPEYYKVYPGTLEDWQLEEWRRRDINGYFEAVYDQVEVEIRKIFEHLEITQETPKRVAVKKLTDHLIRNSSYTLDMMKDVQGRGKFGDEARVFVDKNKKLFTGYEKKGQYELDEMFRVLLTKKGVCISYSILLSNMLDRLGVTNAILLIKVPGQSVGHAAVVVSIDDNEYVIDPVLEQSKMASSAAAKGKKKDDMFYNIKIYREILKKNFKTTKNIQIDRAELENSYFRIEQYIMALKKNRADKQNRAAENS